MTPLNQDRPFSPYLRRPPRDLAAATFDCVIALIERGAAKRFNRLTLDHARLLHDHGEPIEAIAHILGLTYGETILSIAAARKQTVERGNQ